MIKMAKFIFTLIFISNCFSGYSQTVKLTLNIQGVQVSKGGQISIGIFKKEFFPKVGKQFIGKEIKVSDNQMQIVIENVPVGVYAIAVFQDINKDKILNLNFFGIPIEPFGFSRDASINFGPPNFDDAKIEIQNAKTFTINLRD